MIDQYLISIALFTGVLQSPVDEVQTRWTTQEQRGNVELYSEIQFDTESLWQQLGAVAREIDQRLDVRSSGKPIQIMVFRNHKNYLNYLFPKIPEASSRKAIYYRNGEVSQIYAYQSRSLLTDLRHEMTHAILHQHLPFIPLWLDEGLAEYFEEQETLRNTSPRISSVQWKARVGSSPSLLLLESVPSAKEMDAAVYRDSWAWVAFLLNDSQESLGVLQSYLSAIHGGEAPGPFSSFAETRILDFQGRANSYFRKIRFRVAFDSSREP